MSSEAVSGCDQCKGQAVTFVRYSGAHLCKKHFNEFVKNRVKKEMRKQGKLPGNAIMAVAVSGGKDSLAMLHILSGIFENHKDLTLVAISIDEGIHPYRTESLEMARAACKKLGIEHRIMSFSERFGHSLDDIVKAEIPELLPCSYCGVFRRVCLNSLSKELNAGRLAVGHNLDDNAQSVLMNICKGDFNKLFRLGPHKIIKPGLVPRIMPLRTIPEKEIYLYTLLNGIEAYTGECPYADLAQRGLYRTVLNQLEYKSPGTRHAIINIYDQLYDGMEDKLSSVTMKGCSRCGEPATGDICKACQMLEKIEQVE
jgi:uncharacterized protein (TIGR00269 family)